MNGEKFRDCPKRGGSQIWHMFDLLRKNQNLSQLILLTVCCSRPSHCFSGLVTEGGTWLKALDQNRHRDKKNEVSAVEIQQRQERSGKGI